MTILQSGAIASTGGGYQIERSLRFNPADTAYLSRTFSTPTNNKKWTMSGWIKRGAINDGNYNTLFARYVDGNNFMRVDLLGDNLRMYQYKSANDVLLRSTLVLRDPSAWYHFLVIYDSDNATSSNRVLFYINNTQITSFSSSTYPSSGSSSIWNTSGGASHQIGTFNANGSGEAFSGLMTECYFIDGQALTPSSFGETDSNTGVWKPKAFSGTYGTNGFYLKFADNSGTTSTTLGKDSSGNGNNWTPNNFSVTAGAGNDSLVDSPTAYGTDSGLGAEVRGNYATWNPLVLFPTTTYQSSITDGNLLMTKAGAGQGGAVTTIGATTGKFYAELTIVAVGTSVPRASIVADANPSSINISNEFVPGYTATSISYLSNGSRYTNATTTASWGSTFTTNDVIGIAFDADSGKVWFAKNGTWQASGNPAAGTNQAATLTITGPFYFASCTEGSGSIAINAGQRPFAYTAPSGFKALCTQNLPTPTIGATSTTQANDYFNAVTYTGTGSTRSVTGVGFQPSFVWIKGRSTASSHHLFDAVRGVPKVLFTDGTYAEETRTNSFTSFDSDGFTVGSSSDGNTNVNTTTYVAWNWKANGAGSSNTAGTITSTVSANTTSGFSIVQWTGSGANGTVGHGLGVAPQFMFMKNKTNSGTGWPSYHAFIDASAPQNYYISLADTAGRVSASNAWNNTAPTSSVFSVGSSSFSNGGTMIAYVFAPVAGYSAFGSYTGNNSDDGPFIFTNFRPAFVLIKAINTTQWWTLLDSKRDTYNVSTLGISPNSSDAESTFNTNRGPHKIDFTSNGFKIRTSGSGINGTNTFIYAAFAETPAKFSLAR